MRHLILLLSLAVAFPVTAQEVSFTAGARGDLAIPTGEDMEDAETGFGLGVEGTIHFTPIFGLYASFSQFSFGIDEDDTEFRGDFTDTGFGLGAHINIPVADAPVSPWLRLGAIYNVFEVDLRAQGVNLSFESDRELGFEVGGGLDYPLGDSGLLLQPAVRYRTHNPTFDAFGATSDGTVAYFAVGVGVAYFFGEPL